MTTIVRIRLCSVIRSVMIASLESSLATLSRESTCERRLLAKKVAFVRHRADHTPFCFVNRSYSLKSTPQNHFEWNNRLGREEPQESDVRREVHELAETIGEVGSQKGRQIHPTRGRSKFLRVSQSATDKDAHSKEQTAI